MPPASRRPSRPSASARPGALAALLEEAARGRKITWRRRPPLLPSRPAGFGAERIRAIRRRLNVSQSVFAELLYVTKGSVAKWEQGLRTPAGPGLRLLEILEQNPFVLLERQPQATPRPEITPPAA